MPYLSQSEKVKLAEQIKPISQEQAKNSYLDLADEKTIPPSTSTIVQTEWSSDLNGVFSSQSAIVLRNISKSIQKTSS